MRAPRQQGLTLLEVLAAFLIFSMVFTVLVGSSQSAVRSQGLSIRRLAANEVADSMLADLEIPLARYELPVIEEEEFLLEDFTVRVVEGGLSGDSSASSSGAGLPDLGDGLGIASLLESQLPEVSKYMKRYKVEVEWLEGNEIQKVSRTTFGFDWPAAELDTAGLIGAAAATRAGTDPSDAATDPNDETGADGAGDSNDPGNRDRKSSKQTEIDRMLQLIRDAEANR